MRQSRYAAQSTGFSLLNMQAAAAAAHFVAGRYAEATSSAAAAVRRHPDYIFANSILAASAALGGRPAEAEKGSRAYPPGASSAAGLRSYGSVSCSAGRGPCQMGGGPAEGWDTRVIADQVDNWRMSAVGTSRRFAALHQIGSN